MQRATALAESGDADSEQIARVQQLAAELNRELEDRRLLAALDRVWMAKMETDPAILAIRTGLPFRSCAKRSKTMVLPLVAARPKNWRLLSPQSPRSFENNCCCTRRVASGGSVCRNSV